MRRKCLAWLLLACLVLSFVPMSGMAEGDPAASPTQEEQIILPEGAATVETGQVADELPPQAMTPQAMGFEPAPELLRIRVRVNDAASSYAAAGDWIYYLLQFSKPVHYTSGVIHFDYGDIIKDGSMTYRGGSGTDTLTFGYLVPSPEELPINQRVSMGSPSFRATGWESCVIDDGVYRYTDSSGNVARIGPSGNYPILYAVDSWANQQLGETPWLAIDNTPPRVTRIWTGHSTGTYTGELYFVVEFSEAVSLGGQQTQLKFNNGGETSSVLHGSRPEWVTNLQLQPDEDTRVVCYYLPNANQSIDVLNVQELIVGDRYDQAGNRLSPALPVGANLADQTQLRIVAPEGEEIRIPYAVAYPTTHTGSYLKDLSDQAPRLNYLTIGWASTDIGMLYHWSQSPDIAVGRAYFGSPANREASAWVSNGGTVSAPTDVEAAGVYYLYYSATYHRSSSHYNHTMAFLDSQGESVWAAGPFWLDCRAPSISFPLDSSKPYSARYLIPVEVSDEHSGLQQVTYQWFAGDTALDSPQAISVNAGRAWVMAPINQGSYRLQVSATDVAGNTRGMCSPPYAIVATQGVPVSEQFSAAISPAGNARMRVVCFFSAGMGVPVNDVLGQCFQMWLPASQAGVGKDWRPDAADGRWRQFYNGLNSATTLDQTLQAPAELPSGDYYFYVLAYDQIGNPHIASYGQFIGDGEPIGVSIDNSPPVVTITPNGSGPVDSVEVIIEVRDDSPLPSFDDMDFYLALDTTNIWEDDSEVYPFQQMDLTELERSDSLVKWRLTLPYPYPYDGAEFRHIYTDRPQPPFYLLLDVKDAVGNVTQAYSNPFYLDINPPDVAVTANTQVGSSRHLKLTVDTHRESGVEYCYIFDNGAVLEELWFGDDGEPMPHYYVRPDAAWSAWQPVGAAMTIPLPADLSPGEHRVSLRFRDAFGNEARCFVYDYGREELGEPLGYLYRELLWTTNKVFTYNPVASEQQYTAPVLQYSTLTPTRVGVQVTLRQWDEYGYPLSADEWTHIFEENGSHVFHYCDAWGNAQEVTATVNWIDRTRPNVYVRYSTEQSVPTRSNVLAEVYADEPFWVIMDSGYWGETSHLFKENGSFQFRVQDYAGNETTVTAEVMNIDRTPPQVQVNYQAPENWGDPVVVMLTGDEPFIVLNEPYSIGGDPSGRYTYSTHKTYKFGSAQNIDVYIEDRAGNSSTVRATPGLAHRGAPEVSVKLTPSQPTAGDVKIQLYSSEPITLLGVDSQPTEAFTASENGSYTLRYRDADGRLFTKTVEVTLIDRQAPDLRFSGSEQRLIKQGDVFDPLEDVRANDQYEGDISSRIEVVENPVDVNTPGSYTVTYRVRDTAGNSGLRQREVRVMGDQRLAVFVNGQAAGLAGELSVTGNVLLVDCFGAHGQCVVRWAEGKRPDGVFKYISNNGTDAFGNRVGIAIGSKVIVPLRYGGWYTLYVQDEDQQTLHLQVYVDYR